MKKKILFNLGIGAIVMAYVLNLSYATDNYGIKTNSLSFSVLAQSGSSSGGGGSSSSGGGWCKTTVFHFDEYNCFETFWFFCDNGNNTYCYRGSESSGYGNCSGIYTVDFDVVYCNY